MADVLPFFMSSEDERGFLRFLERFPLELYPVRVPADWKPPKVAEAAYDRMPEDAAYLAAPECGPILVDRVKRGKDKGAWRIDEVRSPVIFFERSRIDEETGELRSGKLWAELEVTPQTGRRDAAPDRFRKLFLEVEQQLKSYRRSEPKGYCIGPDAARRWKTESLVLRVNEHRGATVRPFR